jgi:coenzyme Q-binding protein COQ10
MATYREVRTLNYSSRQIFELVAQVERYPEFLPLWKKVRVSHTEQNHSEQSVYYTDQTIQLGPVVKAFHTKTILKPYYRIQILSPEPMFRKFEINWFFKGDSEDKSKIEFTLDCVASSILLRPVFDITLQESAKTIITAFENRAKGLYGHLN